MRSIKKTSISFSLVNVACTLYKANEDGAVKFSQAHDGCGGGVSYQKVCKACEQHLSTSDIVRAITRNDTQVIVTDDDLTSVETDTGPAISVLQFIQADEIDAVATEGGHFFVVPTKDSLQGFTLLRTVMSDSGKVAIVRFSLRSGKQNLGILRPYGDRAMIIDTISFPAEIREPAFDILAAPVTLDPALLKVASDLVSAMSAPFDPADYTDVYSEKVNALIDAKSRGDIVTTPDTEPAPVVSNLLRMLEASAAAKQTAKPAAGKTTRRTPAKPRARRMAAAS